MQQSVKFRIAENERKIANIVKLAIVEEVYLDTAQVTVRAGDIVTRKIKFWTPFASAMGRAWIPPTKGSAGILLSLGGETNTSFFIPGLFTSKFSQPATDSDLHLFAFSDGVVMSYNLATSALSVTGLKSLNVTGSQSCDLTFEGGVNITAPTVAVDGDISCTGTITASEDVLAGDISLKNHIHKGVKSGEGTSGKPL